MHSEVDQQSTASSEPDPLAAELAVALDRLRRVRAALAAYGAPLAPVAEETDRLLAMGERLAAKVAERQRRPRDERPPAA